MRALGVAVCFLLLSGAAASAADLPSFDAASVKRSDPNNRAAGSNVCAGGPGTSDPTTYHCVNAGLSLLILNAYQVKFYELICPNWVMQGGADNGYDITAKVSPGATKEQLHLMLQRLLAERFHLVVHTETRDLPAYALVPGKSSAKLTPSTTPVPPGQKFGQVYNKHVFSWIFRNTTLADFAAALTTQLWSPVVDETGLAGAYDFKLDFIPDERWQSRTNVHPVDSPGDEGETLFAAIPDQLGLKLESRKAPVKVLVFDSADKTPSAN